MADALSNAEKMDLSTKTRDSKGNIKWQGLKDHLEKLLTNKPDTLIPVTGGFQEFEERVEQGRIKAGYIIYMTRTLEDTSGGQMVASLDWTGLLAYLIKKIVNREYMFSHVAIYVGKWENTHYFVDNGGPNTGQEFLTEENRKKYHSAIRLIDAKRVISSTPLITMTIPWGQLIETEQRKKRKLWPNQEEFIQMALASVGFPFNYQLRTRNCETFTLLLLGIGDIDTREVFPQLGIVTEGASKLSELYTGPSQITENDIKDFQEFQTEFKNWIYGRGHLIDTSDFKVEGGKVVTENEVSMDLM